MELSLEHQGLRFFFYAGSSIVNNIRSNLPHFHSTANLHTTRAKSTASAEMTV